MRYYRKNNKKELVLIALLVAVVGMSLGFAAFSSTLNISSSANVNPNSSDFKIAFSTTQYAVDTNNTNCKISEGIGNNGGIGGIGCVKSNAVSDMAAVFTKPGQSVDFKIYVHNTGQYDAYLSGINYNALANGTYKMCSASTTDSTKATDSLVQAACEGINVSITVGGNTYSLGNNIFGHKLSKGSVEELVMRVEYVSGSALADGPFNVEISDFQFNYSTVDNVALIKFYIYEKGTVTEHYAEAGMTMDEWVKSSYNTSKFSSVYDFCTENDSEPGSVSIIALEETYYTGTACLA